MTEAENRSPSFDIPTPPERRFSRTSFEYVGAVVFTLTPPEPGPGSGAPSESDASACADADLEALLLDVLERPPYRYGDWLDLPMPLYLVHDDETGDTFRVAVRDGRIELHVLPETESGGLRALYDRLVAETAGERGGGGGGGGGAGGGGQWTVDRRVDPPE